MGDHCSLRISVIRFEYFRSTVTGFAGFLTLEMSCGSFRLFTSVRPTNSHEDWTKADWHDPNSGDSSSLRGSWLRSENVDDNCKTSRVNEPNKVEMGNGSQIFGTDGSRADDIPVSGSIWNRDILEEPDS